MFALESQWYQTAVYACLEWLSFAMRGSTFEATERIAPGGAYYTSKGLQVFSSTQRSDG